MKSIVNQKRKTLLSEYNIQTNNGTAKSSSDTKKNNNSSVKMDGNKRKRGRPRNDEIANQVKSMNTHGQTLPFEDIPYNPEDYRTKKYNTNVLSKLSKEQRDGLGISVSGNEFRYRVYSLAAASKPVKKSLSGK